MQVEIQPLSSTHNRNKFDCSVSELNDWFANMAGQQDRKGIAKVFVAVDSAAPATPLGYYALVVSQINGREIPDKLPDSVPVILLARLAVDQYLQGKGLGKDLLMNALEKVASISSCAGVVAVIVHAKDQKAIDFYAHYGFVSCVSNPSQMFLPISTIKSLL